MEEGKEGLNKVQFMSNQGSEVCKIWDPRNQERIWMLEQELKEGERNRNWKEREEQELKEGERGTSFGNDSFSFLLLQMKGFNTQDVIRRRRTWMYGEPNSSISLSLSLHFSLSLSYFTSFFISCENLCDPFRVDLQEGKKRRSESRDTYMSLNYLLLRTLPFSLSFFSLSLSLSLLHEASLASKQTVICFFFDSNDLYSWFIDPSNTKERVREGGKDSEGEGEREREERRLKREDRKKGTRLYRYANERRGKLRLWGAFVPPHPFLLVSRGERERKREREKEPGFLLTLYPQPSSFKIEVLTRKDEMKISHFGSVSIPQKFHCLCLFHASYILLSLSCFLYSSFSFMLLIFFFLFHAMLYSSFSLIQVWLNLVVTSLNSKDLRNRMIKLKGWLKTVANVGRQFENLKNERIGFIPGCVRHTILEREKERTI